MSTKDNSITTYINHNSISSPLKTSVILISTLMIAACGTDNTWSNNVDNVSSTIIYKPKTPTEIKLIEADTKLSGTVEPNNTVKIKDSTNKEIGSAVADASGKFLVTFSKPLTKGETIQVEAYYPAGTRASDVKTVEVPGTTNPESGGDDNNPTTAPEATKSGVQAINIGTSVAGLQDFVATTRDFTIANDKVTARADIASNNLLPKVEVIISGSSDTQVSNGFKSHNDNTIIPTALGNLPLQYTSVYKSYNDVMNIGHIDGVANLNGKEIPVNGVAVTGNATKAENIPTEGKADYSGDATLRKLGIGNEIEFGKSELTADFAAKKLDGKLKFSKAGDLSLSAAISGNKFSGDKTEGGFYGVDAKYLGGIYNSAVAQGTFAATKGGSTVPTSPTSPSNPAVPSSQSSNSPESAKTGAQTLNVNVKPLNQVFKTTTRDFTASNNDVVARADIASNNLLGKLTLTTSASGDSSTTNGFKNHSDSAEVAALGQKLPLTYSSVYKDFDTVMRIGHIDGKAIFSGIELPVNGVAVIGNATKVENMPTEGTAAYMGDATYRQLGIGNAIEFGSSEFNADFAAKKVDGSLKFNQAGSIGISANISGNKFSGTSVEGGFYGGDAQFLGGIYTTDNAQGTFGAKKK
ncbi:transferrin-binding protein-like solute binding protein [Psychrobacter sp.]|uniref:transferrin-binding protein-like solute binding protein n=1 Tax=Psychrobacter sp. TaxID=56811 RepID=UPI0025DADE82|nr:transferrin-binding protein-like solute binding protein [Psychrobacter sp.]